MAKGQCVEGDRNPSKLDQRHRGSETDDRTSPPLCHGHNDTMANLGRINIEPEFCCCCAGIRGRMFLGPELAMVVKL